MFPYIAYESVTRMEKRSFNELESRLITVAVARLKYTNDDSTTLDEKDTVIYRGNKRAVLHWKKRSEEFLCHRLSELDN